MIRFVVLALLVPLVALAMSFQLMVQPVHQAQKQAKPASTITYVLGHPLHTVHGVSKQVDSQLSLAENGRDIQQVQVSVPVASFDSGNRARDRDMLKVTEASQYPNVTFRSDAITNKNGELAVSGLLTFHGESKQIDFVAQQQRQGDELIVTGGFDISLEAYSIKRPSIMTMKVKDNLQVKFRMVYPTGT